MKLLIAGAGGMLGRDVVLAAGNAGHDVVGFGHSELDVTDPAALERKFDLERPDLAINCAAWTDVDGAEESEEAAFAVNGSGAGNVAAAAAKVGAGVLYVSSDYVFDGGKGSPYVESDQPAPISAYGRTKLAGEEATAAANKRHFIVRSAWLFGIGGGNFVETMLRLADSQNEVLVVRDQVGSPTYTWHLAYGIVRLIEGIEYGIHHMAAAGHCSWYEFAREIFEQAEVECKVLSGTTEMLGRPAPRPAFSALASQREHAILLPSWQDGLAGYLAQRQGEGT
ncbi:MAG TPA: dTDP-4-dehydrorhamnose reductase [Solirubrobacterales bacterium]|jgi:dTDP-4-dehydrorhamnose reductase|nr:dTDP-4-dehydrorhamnose reductase [Solirubrobacterales bacterium]